VRGESQGPGTHRRGAYQPAANNTDTDEPAADKYGARQPRADESDTREPEAGARTLQRRPDNSSPGAHAAPATSG
jgi:hypothetical protein